MRVVFFGTPDFASSILDKLCDNFEVAGVVTAEDKPRGRKGEPVPSEVKALALSKNIPVHTTSRVRDEKSIEWIREKDPDVIVTAAFGQIVPKTILDMPKYGCLNVHASLLPAYRGAAPIQHAILDGCKTTGVSIMRMDEGLDTGDIVSVSEIKIEDDETSGTLFDKLAKLGADLIVTTIRDIEAGNVTYREQPEKSTTEYAATFKKEDGLIDFDCNADYLERKIRALNPWPCAYTFLKGKMIKIWAAKVSDEKAGAPGEVKSVDGKIIASCKEGSIEILELQAEGKKRMKAKDYLMGHAVEGIFTKNRENASGT